MAEAIARSPVISGVVMFGVVVDPSSSVLLNSQDWFYVTDSGGTPFYVTDSGGIPFKVTG